MKKKMGRPRFFMDWDLFDRLAYMQCTLEEIAFGVGCSADTVEACCKREREMTFSEYYKKRSAGGKVSLRRAMWKNAVENNNTGMQIWLSKQHLGMTEKVETVNETTVEQVFEITFSDESAATDQAHTAQAHQPAKVNTRIN